MYTGAATINPRFKPWVGGRGRRHHPRMTASSSVRYLKVDNQPKSKCGPMKYAILTLLTLFSLHLKAQNYSADVTATDAVGRRLPDRDQAGDLKKDKFVGLF